MHFDRELPTFLKSTLLILLSLIGIITALSYMNLLNDLPKFTIFPHKMISKDVNVLRNAFYAASRVATLLLAMLISGMAIAVPLAANNYTPRVIRIFVRDLTNRFMFGLLLCFGAVSMWLSFSRDEQITILSARICFLLFLLSVSAIVPYLFHLFSFLNPNCILYRLRVKAERNINKAARCHNNKKQLFRYKHITIENMDSIANIALGALQRNDRQTFIAAMRHIQYLAIHYSKLKPYLPKSWHNLDIMEIGIFMGMLAPARKEIQEKKITLELHICQFLLEFFESVSGKTRDAVDPVAFTAYQIASHYIYSRDEEAISMYSSLFNSVLRLAINTKNLRMIYNSIDHYRNLAVDVIPVMPNIAIRIAEDIFRYASLTEKRSGHYDFVVELAAYEIRKMIELVLRRKTCENFDVIQRILDILYKIPTKNREGQPILGVIKARVSLSSILRKVDKCHLIDDLIAPLFSLSQEHLKQIHHDLIVENPLRYREVTARQMNLDYIYPDARPQIDAIITQAMNKK